MGWWEQKSSRWQACIVAQVGGAAALGGGVFFLQFRSPDLGTVRPIFLALAGGAGVGGSIGSAVSIPYSDVVRQLINPQFHPSVSDYGWSDLNGNFSCEEIQRERFDIAQAGASAVVLGAQFAVFTITEVHLFDPDRTLCSTRINIPRSLPQVGTALLDLPQMQGGLGAGAFAFRGTLFYIGS